MNRQLLRPPFMQLYPAIKRFLDVLLSASALLILWPLCIVLALLIRMESPGNPIFRQQRVGYGGKHFTIYKFRSMVKNADKLGSEVTLAQDARITPLGRLLRRTSLDELPQLANVLMGDMSLIGPRPNTPSQSTTYSPEVWEKRLVVRPGITGLAQVNGRSDMELADQIRYDMEYIDSLSFSLDWSILKKTIRDVLAAKGTN